MPSRVFHIYKQLPFGTGDEEFSNAYRYTVDSGVFDTPDGVPTDVLIMLRNMEQQAHSNAVQFTRGTSAPISSLNNVGDIDVEVFWDSEFGAIVPPTSTTVGAPENVVMVQEKVGPKSWIRKYLHTVALQFSIAQDGISFNWQSSGDAWSGVVAYAADFPILESSGTQEPFTARYETPSNLVSDGNVLIDDRIRWHDLKY